MDSDDNSLCKICFTEFSKYSCPRCDINYCSVNCYRSESHSECSEIFYKNCIISELNENDESSKQQILEALKRVNETVEDIDSDDDEEVDDLEVRLHEVDLDDADEVWNALTEDERQEYEALVKSDRIFELVTVWTPWWETKVQKRRIEEVGQASPKDYLKLCPELLQGITPFELLSKAKPAECLRFNLLNIIGAYACIQRYFNGNCLEFSKEAIYLLTQLSKNLQGNANFETYSLALESVYQQALINDWMVTDSETKDRIYKDVQNIIEGPEEENKTFYLQSALSDIYRLIKESKHTKRVDNSKEFAKKFNDIELPKDKIVPDKTLNSYIMKIKYFLSYVDCIGHELY